MQMECYVSICSESKNSKNQCDDDENMVIISSIRLIKIVPKLKNEKHQMQKKVIICIRWCHESEWIKKPSPTLNCFPEKQQLLL